MNMKILVSVVGTLLIGIVLIYHFFFGTCTYFAEEIIVPNELESGKVIFTKDIRHTVSRSGGFGCSSGLNEANGKIVAPDRINKKNIDAMYAYKGIQLEDMRAGEKEFKVTKILKVASRGMFSSGPKYYLILSDIKTGELYSIAIVSLFDNGAGYGQKDIAVLRTQSKDYPLNYNNFYEYDSKTAKSKFNFRLDPEENSGQK